MNHVVKNLTRVAALALPLCAVGLAGPSVAHAAMPRDTETIPADDPVPGAIIPIDGYVETHTHSLGRYGYGGRYMHGENDASAIDISVDLAPCTGNDHAVSWLPRWLTSIYKWGDEIERGSHGGNRFGFDSDEDTLFKDWPVFSTTTHQQMHPDWIEDLHNAGVPSGHVIGELDQNMKIFLMSAVNFRALCTFIPQRHGDIDPATGSPFDCDDDVNLERQIAKAWEMSFRDKDGRLNPGGFEWFQVVTSHSQAVATVASGRLAVVLHLEASELMDSGLADPPLTFAGIDNRLSRYYGMGVRSFQPVHEVNNQFGGVGVFPGSGILSTMMMVSDAFRGHTPTQIMGELVVWTARVAWARLWGLPRPAFPFALNTARYRVATDGDGFNQRGLTNEGLYLVRAAMCENMLVDVAHMGEKSFLGTLRSSQNAYAMGGPGRHADDDYPMFHSHARFRSVHAPADQAEYYYSDEQIAAINETGGMIGLRTSNMPVDLQHPTISNSCEGSTRTWVQSYFHGIDTHAVPMGIASDMNSAVAQLRPRFRDMDSKWNDGSWLGGERYSKWACNGSGATDVADAAVGDRVGTEYDLIGFGRYDLMDDIMIDAENLGQPVNRIKNESARAFLSMWERAEESNASFRTPAMQEFCNITYGNRDNEGHRPWIRSIGIQTDADMDAYLSEEAHQAALANAFDIDPYPHDPNMQPYDDWSWLMERPEQTDYVRAPVAPIEVAPTEPCTGDSVCAVPTPLNPDYPPAWLTERIESQVSTEQQPLEPWQAEYLANLQWPEENEQPPQ